jgi:hypothetical protein
MSSEDLDRVRGATLDHIDRSERAKRAIITVAAVLEASFLITFVLLADFTDRLHLLLLLSTVAVYGLLALGLMALGAHVSRCAERVLRAIEVTRADSARKGPASGSEG